MAGSWVHVHRLVAVVLLPLVLVHNSETNGRAQRDAKLGTGLYLHAIFLITRSRYGRLARSSTRHLGLDVVVCKGHAWRATIDNGTNRQAMRLAIAGPWLELNNYKSRLGCIRGDLEVCAERRHCDVRVWDVKAAQNKGFVSKKVQPMMSSSLRERNRESVFRVSA
jgi:hypothetical protein